MGSYTYLPDKERSLDDIKSVGEIERNPGSLKLIFSLLDLTSLNTDETATKVRSMCEKLNRFKGRFPGYPPVGAICVYPLLVPVVNTCLLAREVNIASVAGGFPSSQTFPEIKVMECRKAFEAGASEIDVVMSLGKFLENELEYVSGEIRQVSQAIGHAKLKVILETGLLPDPAAIYRASMVSMESGADWPITYFRKLSPWKQDSRRNLPISDFRSLPYL